MEKRYGTLLTKFFSKCRSLAKTVVSIGWSTKLNHHKQIYFVQIHEMLSIKNQTLFRQWKQNTISTSIQLL